jgi:hypothetical protein
MIGFGCDKTKSGKMNMQVLKRKFIDKINNLLLCSLECKSGWDSVKLCGNGMNIEMYNGNN